MFRSPDLNRSALKVKRSFSSMISELSAMFLKCCRFDFFQQKERAATAGYAKHEKAYF